MQGDVADDLLMGNWHPAYPKKCPRRTGILPVTNC